MIHDEGVTSAFLEECRLNKLTIFDSSNFNESVLVVLTYLLKSVRSAEAPMSERDAELVRRQAAATSADAREDGEDFDHSPGGNWHLVVPNEPGAAPSTPRRFP